MKHSAQRKTQPGYVSLLAVFTMSMFMLLLTLFAYKRSLNTHGIQAEIQSRNDYMEKEESILRSIVAITPNRAIRAMQSGSNASDATRNPLRWQNIFSEALDQSNARRSVSTELQARLNVTNSVAGNSGDSALATVSRMFKSTAGNTGFVSAALNRNLGTGYPPSLNSTNAIANDDIYPIITKKNTAPSRAEGSDFPPPPTKNSTC